MPTEPTWLQEARRRAKPHTYTTHTQGAVHDRRLLLMALAVETARAETAEAEASDLLIPAFRYYLGRMTIATCAFAERLARRWLDLPAGQQQLIRDELERAFADDDRARAAGKEFKPLGMDCDRESWALVRAAYTA